MYVPGTRMAAFRTNRRRSARRAWARRLRSLRLLLGFPVFPLASTCPRGPAQMRSRRLDKPHSCAVRWLHHEAAEQPRERARRWPAASAADAR